MMPNKEFSKPAIDRKAAAKIKGKAGHTQLIHSNYFSAYANGNSCARAEEQSSVSAESEFRREDLYITDEMLGLPKIEFKKSNNPPKIELKKNGNIANKESVKDVNQDLYDLYEGNSQSSASKNEFNFFDNSSGSKPLSQ